MTQGNSMKLIFQFFLPILIGNLFQQLYSFVDSMVVGKGIGDVALAAVGNTSSVHFLILGFAMGLTGGLGICISHSFGANDIEKLRKEIAMSVYICLAIGIVITVGILRPCTFVVCVACKGVWWMPWQTGPMKDV